MKLLKNFLYLLLIFASASTFAVRSNLFIKGGDEQVLNIFGGTAPNYLLPSNRHKVKLQVENSRLFIAGFDEKSSSSFPIHEQIANGENTFDHPSDSIAAILQTLFPSPDREQLIPNQAAIDPIGELTPQQVGRIFFIVSRFERETLFPPSDELSDIAHFGPRKILIDALKETLTIKKETKIKRLYKEFLKVESNPQQKSHSGKVKRDLKLFRRFRFFDLLVKAVELQNSDDFNDFPYIDNIIERALITFAWEKASDLASMDTFYQAVSCSPDFSLPTQVYRKEDYDTTVQFLKESTDLPSTLESISNEHLYLALIGEKFFSIDSFLSREYSSVIYTSQKRYANCVETSLFNFFINVSRCLEEEVVFDEMVFPEDSLLRDFFSTSDCTPDNILELETLQKWSDILVRHQYIKYVNKDLETGEKSYELYPGFVNLHNLIHTLLGHTQECYLPYEDHVLGELEETFQQLAQDLSRPNFSLTLEFGEDMKYNSTLGDFTGEITFSRNGNKFFTWNVTSNHSYLSEVPTSTMTDSWASSLNRLIYPKDWSWGDISLTVDKTTRPCPDGSHYQKHFDKISPKILEAAAFLNSSNFVYVPRYARSQHQFKNLISIANFKNWDKEPSTSDSYLDALSTTLMRPQNKSQFQTAILSLASRIGRLNDESSEEDFSMFLPVLMSICEEEAGQVLLEKISYRSPKTFLRTSLFNSRVIESKTCPFGPYYQEYYSVALTPYESIYPLSPLFLLNPDQKIRYFQHLKEKDISFQYFYLKQSLSDALDQYDAWSILRNLEGLSLQGSISLSPNFEKLLASPQLKMVNFETLKLVSPEILDILDKKVQVFIRSQEEFLKCEEKESFLEALAEKIHLLQSKDCAFDERIDFHVATYREVKILIRALRNNDLDYKKFVEVDHIKEPVFIQREDDGKVHEIQVYKIYDNFQELPQSDCLKRIEEEIEIEEVVERMITAIETEDNS